MCKITFDWPVKDQKRLEDENKVLKDENAEFKRQLSQIATDHQSETTRLREQVSELESQLKTLELENLNIAELQDQLSSTTNQRDAVSLELTELKGKIW